MDTMLLKYFIAVAKQQHMTRAAAQLHITQPSLTAAIRRLEAEVGAPLFDRVGRNIQLNEYGQIFLSGAEAAVRALNASLEEIRLQKENKASFIQLACSRSPVNSMLIETLLSQGINLRIDDIPADWERQLLDHTCDLVITLGKSSNAEIGRTALCDLQFVIAANRTHPLVGSDSVQPRELNQYPFCSTSRPHALINVAKDELAALGISPRIAFWGQNSNDMLRAIRTGNFLGMMIQRNLPVDPDVVVLPVEGMDISLPIWLYWNQHSGGGRNLPAIRKHIVDFYREYRG